nr:hypothetical protein [Tanacetum cinerariifolium]
MPRANPEATIVSEEELLPRANVHVIKKNNQRDYKFGMEIPDTMINEAIKKSKSELNSTQDDQPITKLSNIVKGDYKFGMEIPDIMINEAIKKLPGYNYYIAKKKESAKDKIIDEPKEQRVSPFKSGRGKGFMVMVIKQSQLTIDSQIDDAVVDTYVEWEQKLKGYVVEDLAVQSLLDLQKGSKASILESLKQIKQGVAGEGSKESDNKTDDADDFDMDLSDDNPNDCGDDAARLGESKKKRRKDVGEPSSRSSRQKKSLVVHAQVDTPAIQPLDQEDENVRNHPNPEWFPKKSGLANAKRSTTRFDLLLKSNIGKNENHILGPSTVAIAKKLKELIQKDELTIADLEEKYTTSITKHYAARYYLQGIEDMIPGRWSKETHRHHFEAFNGIYHWQDSRIEFFKAEIIIVRISDDKEYEVSYVNLHRLSLNDLKDIRVMIQNRGEDIYFRVESYQQIINLTKPMMFFEGVDQRIPFTMTTTHKWVVYLNQHNVKSLMRLSEVTKFCDGTLVKIRENLINMVIKNK